MNFYSFALGSIVLLIKLYYYHFLNKDLKDTLDELQNDANLPKIRTYDFIVVGAGGAGCVLANRLSKYYSVLLLEAGGNPVPATDALIYYFEVQNNPHLEYLYKSVPQKFASAWSNGVVPATAGKMLGGSGSHNGIMYNRGHPKDMDNWANITKDDSWSYVNVLQYFQKAETYIGEYDEPAQRIQHGYNGPMTINTTNSNPFVSTFLKAGSQLGYKVRLDPNGPQIEAFAAVSRSQKRGRRESTYTAYIKPIEKQRKKIARHSLRIERYSTVTEILIDKGSARAYGVAYYRHGIPQLAHATKEVIISAGVYGSPLILMKSGIGPAGMLKEAGIPLVKDLPVGVGLKDHPGVTLYPVTVDESTNSGFPNIGKQFTANEVDTWQRLGTGPLAAIGGQGQAFLVSSVAKKNGESDWPDIQFQIGEGLPPSIGDPPVNQRQPTYWFAIIVGRPKSSGVVTLNTTAYKMAVSSGEHLKEEKLALIDFKLLSNPTDNEILLEGIKIADRTLQTSAFKKYGVQFVNPNLPACAGHVFRSDDYWRCYISQTSGPNFHTTSTCRMGFGVKDKRAVVDSKLNVLGISQLKIVDASIMPAPPNGNPMAAVVMIAEKAAAEILAEWKAKSVLDLLPNVITGGN